MSDTGTWTSADMQNFVDWKALTTVSSRLVFAYVLHKQEFAVFVSASDVAHFALPCAKLWFCLPDASFLDFKSFALNKAQKCKLSNCAFSILRFGMELRMQIVYINASNHSTALVSVSFLHMGRISGMDTQQTARLDVTNTS